MIVVNILTDRKHACRSPGSMAGKRDDTFGNHSIADRFRLCQEDRWLMV